MDWHTIQGRLGVAQDGVAGPATYGALTDVVGNPCQPVAQCLADKAVAYNMTTPARLAEFLAQIANETGGFTRWEENLNYSIKGMMGTWPTHFSLAKAQACIGQPVKIAEAAYGGRMNNGPEGSGDGWKYRGRGALQLTGKAQYAKFGQIIGLNLIDNPDLAADPYNGTWIALEFFKEGNVNDAVDAGNFLKARQITNGVSAIGLENVAHLRSKVLAVLA